MGNLFNEWISLFDEKFVDYVQDEPKELKNVSMLILIIQREFKRIETTLNNKLEDLKITHNKCITQSKPVNDDIILIESSSPEDNYVGPSPSKIKKEDNIKIIPTSPVIERRRKSNLKKMKKTCHLGINVTSNIVPLKTNFINTKANSLSSTNNYTKPNFEKKSDINEDEDIFDSSIIGVTPNVNISKKSKSKFFSPRKKFIHTDKTTLTQMFKELASKENVENNISSDTSSVMDIEQILEKVASAPDGPSGSEPTLKVMKDFKIDSFVKDYDKIPERKVTPKKGFIYKETVRGNAKKQLKGWSCKDCEKFYKGMNLSEEELEKKMDECSKHRARFKPDEETIPGFWDMSIPSSPEDQKSQPTQDKLSQESIGNNSTIYCFYKA